MIKKNNSNAKKAFITKSAIHLVTSFVEKLRAKIINCSAPKKTVDYCLAFKITASQKIGCKKSASNRQILMQK